MPEFHLSHTRDGGPVACSCVIGHDHDAEALTRAEARDQVAAIVTQFRRDAFLTRDHYDTLFANLVARLGDVINRTG